MNQFKSFLFLLLLLLTGVCTAFAQNQLVLDSLSNQTNLLTQLVQSGNYEQAQVETEVFRAFLKRHKLPISPKALVLVSGIYKSNEDERSAARLLTEAELDARRDPNLDTKTALLSALVKECKRWELPDLALTCQQLLSSAQDSLNARQRRMDSSKVKRQLDSLLTLRKLETAAQSNSFVIEKDRAYVLGGVASLIFFALLFANFRNSDRWRKLLEKRALEWELHRGNLEHQMEENVALRHAAEERIAVVEAETSAVQPLYPASSSGNTGPKRDQMALLIEPNRQVVMYLKSLLGDRFDIETASNANEGLQMAANLMPDLVVCDAILNGKIGIDTARQIKLSEKTNHIPVVLLTDRYGNEGKLDALRAGAEAWFTRPVIDDEFDATVNRLLEARKVKHEHFARFLHLYFTENRVMLEDQFLLRTVEMIEQNIADPEFMPEEIARKLQLSKNHFFKKLKVLTGKEPTQLIREMRLEKAKTLLEKRAGTPQVIAELVGFSSPGTFALAFKEYFGENTLLLNLPPIKRLQ